MSSKAKLLERIYHFRDAIGPHDNDTIEWGYPEIFDSSDKSIIELVTRYHTNSADTASTIGSLRKDYNSKDLVQPNAMVIQALEVVRKRASTMLHTIIDIRHVHLSIFVWNVPVPTPNDLKRSQLCTELRGLFDSNKAILDGQLKYLNDFNTASKLQVGRDAQLEILDKYYFDICVADWGLIMGFEISLRAMIRNFEEYELFSEPIDALVNVLPYL